MKKPTDYTLSELETMRDSWYSEGCRLLPVFASIAREMGEPAEVLLREYKVFSTGSVTLSLLEGSGPWDPRNNRFHTRLRVTISVGSLKPAQDPRQEILKPREILVARLDGSTFSPLLDGLKPDDLFYRPGKWLDHVLPFGPIANERERARAIAADNTTRDRIFYQLSMNREV